MLQTEREIQRKLRILKHAEQIGDVSKTCRYFGIGRASYYRWQAAFRRQGVSGLANRRTILKNLANRTAPEIVEKVLYLRQTYHFGPIRIVWYLARYHDIKIYLREKDGKAVRRYQYTAIDDATRVRALKIYDRHTQANAIAFIDHVIARFPFRIREARTDNGHEFQAKFHWHVEDQGIRQAYIKPASPQLNGKVERSHRTGQQEFYQLLTYTDDVDLQKRLAE
jgi:transposase InsO family protein